ncbi:MAG: hypothetical protein BGO39_00410 [Chloroflexi bacterium 54-19]|nr:MAG: hypothetical protein BGO39_00410 [Chloroflexi bacterium 54-19]
MPLLGRLVAAYPATSGQRIFEYFIGQNHLAIRPVLRTVLAISGAPELFQPLFGLLWHSDPQLRELATEGLVKSYKFNFDLPFLDKLLDLMADPDENVRENIAKIIGAHYLRPGRMLYRGRETLSTAQIDRIIEIAEKAEGAVKAALLRVLGSPAEEYLSAVPLLIESLSDPQNPGVIIAAADALIEIKPPVPLAIAPLLDCLNHPDETVRWHAAETLGWVGQTVARVITALLVASNDPVSLVRQKAIISLGIMGHRSGNRVILERLLELTYSADERVRERATYQLGNQEINEPFVLNRLVELLQDPDPTVKTEAIGALGKVGDSRHIPLLEKFITPILVYTIYSEIVGQQAENAIREILSRAS